MFSTRSSARLNIARQQQCKHGSKPTHFHHHLHLHRRPENSIGMLARPARGHIDNISKSSLRAPHSGQVQFTGTSSQRVPGANPSSGQSLASS
jgi:hypothetical protein